MHSTVCLAGSLLVLASLAPAQTFVVDASNGAGTHFLDIPPAVAAVPDGAVLRIRAGVYSAFTIANKSLTLVGASRTTVRVRGIAIGPLGSAQKVVVEDVGLPAGAFDSWAVRVQGAQGHVHLQSLLVPASPFAGPPLREVVVTDSRDVHLHDLQGEAPAPPVDARITGSCVEIHRCAFTGRVQPTAGAPGLSALRAAASRLVVSGSMLTGGRGGSDFFSSFGVGGAAVELTGSELDLGPGNVLTGGEGGIDPTGLGCYQIMRPGGPALHLTASTVRSYGTTLVGGCGPGLMCGTCPARAPALIVDGSSSYTTPPGTAPRAVLRGVPQRGSSIDLVLYAGANEVALLAVGFTPTCLAWPDLVDFAGILTLPEIVVPPLSTNAAGTTSYTLPLPNDFVLDRMVWAQFFTFPGFVLPGRGSNTVTILARS